MTALDEELRSKRNNELRTPNLEDPDSFDKWWESYAIGQFGLNRYDMEKAFEAGIQEGLNTAEEYQ